ncbi:hypothetical protein EIP91_000112 [Steccherinum ochraceum]|uniref:AB hydrolase-1 domain-containing protein n=1 Tax=Steccherinum ochraceum TaxID=92696 RepID=A0A4R0RSP1_9APHY|nr:hypothetical protein EIP91_000112 [Steccherinum ochraceum]
MSSLQMISYGPLAIHDSGAPVGVEKYTTVVILHGLAFHSGTFAPMLKYAHKHRARIVLVNRRGYPGSKPYTDEEMAQLKLAQDAGSGAEGAAAVRLHLQTRVCEVNQLLATFIAKEGITKEGGIVLAGWSLGVIYVNAFLAYAPTIPVGEVDVGSYIKRVVVHDAPDNCMGYPRFEGGYNPLMDPSLPPGEGAKRFPAWVSAYYKHGPSLSSLEGRHPLPTPSSTLLSLTEDEMNGIIHPPAGEMDGADMMLAMIGLVGGLTREVRRQAVVPPPEVEGRWREVPYRHVWGEHSHWMIPSSQFALEKEVEEARKEGLDVRRVEAIQLKGANHFASWDHPEQLLQAFIESDATKVDVL